MQLNGLEPVLLEDQAIDRRAINAPLADGDADDLIFDNDSAGEIADVASFRVADGAIPQCQRALLLKTSELDHAAAHPGVAGSGEPLFAPTRAALIRRAG